MGNNFTNNNKTNTSHLKAFLNKQLQCIDKVKTKVFTNKRQRNADRTKYMQ
jgi:hypothetical protein